MKRLAAEVYQFEEEIEEEMPTAMEFALRQAMGDSYTYSQKARRQEKTKTGRKS